MERNQFRMGGGDNRRRNIFKNFGFLALIILFILIIFAALNQPSQLKSVPFSQVIAEANSGKIQQITVKDQSLEITPKGQTKATEKSNMEAGVSIYQQGLQQGKVVLVNEPSSSGSSTWVDLFVGTVL